MPRTCLACASPNRSEIDGALVSGEPLRNIAKRVSISAAALFRHKSHAAQAIVKASERREEQLGDNLYDEMRRVQHKAWELLGKAEADGDVRGAIVALREARECVGTLDDLLGKAAVRETGAEQPQLQIAIVHIGRSTPIPNRGGYVAQQQWTSWSPNSYSVGTTPSSGFVKPPSCIHFMASSITVRLG